MAHYKLWVQVERCPDDNKWEDYEDASEPICIGDFDTEAEANRRLYALGLMFDGLTPEEVAAGPFAPDDDDDDD